LKEKWKSKEKQNDKFMNTFWLQNSSSQVTDNKTNLKHVQDSWKVCEKGVQQTEADKTGLQPYWHMKHEGRHFYFGMSFLFETEI
jgi:hypothetical protein